VTIIITYFVHGTTTDNENGISTGWNHGGLSKPGREQCIELKTLIKNIEFDVVFSSDLKRAIDSAQLTFGNRHIPIIEDERLRECDYGDLNGADSKKVKSMAMSCIDNPFPNGESHKDVEKRVRNLLEDIHMKYQNKNIAVVSHKAPQLALDVIIKGKNWKEAIKEDWRLKNPKEWRPGWNYTFG